MEDAAFPHDLRRKICRLIAGIVVTDDELDAAEDAFIDRMLGAFAIPQSERDTIFPIVDRDEAESAMRELPAEARARAFELLLDAASADGRIADEERAYLHAVARVVGVSEAEVDDRLRARLPGADG